MTEYKPSLADKRPPINTGYIGNLLSEVFGVESPVYVPWFIQRDKKYLPFPDVEVMQDIEYENAPVRYGQKTFGAFWLKGGSYLNYDHTGKLITSKYPDFLMPLATLVDFSREKETFKTPVCGGGTVKETYTLLDWNITINGIILPDKFNPYTQQTVSQQMEVIQNFHEIAGSIIVEGQLFAQREITRIVTETLKFSPIQGRPNMMQYSITAVSDNDTDFV